MIPKRYTAFCILENTPYNNDLHKKSQVKSINKYYHKIVPVLKSSISTYSEI